MNNRELAYKVAKVAVLLHIAKREWEDSDGNYFRILNLEDQLKYYQRILKLDERSNH